VSEYRLEVTIDRDLCRGSHSCVRRAPESFSSDAEDKAVFRTEGADEKRVVRAATACPTFAIQVVKQGRRLV
jgi:ferredoxin